MATRRTWVWVVVGAAGVGLLLLVGIAGSGVYFVSHHVHAERASSPEAIHSFQFVLTSLGSSTPLYEIDATDDPRLLKPLADFPTADVPSDTLWMMAWDPEQDRLVRVSMPFWLLRFGSHKMRVMHGGNGFEVERLHLDVDELARIGPALVIDFRNQDGARVLVWTR
jgi:hypothetical protein